MAASKSRELRTANDKNLLDKARRFKKARERHKELVDKHRNWGTRSIKTIMNLKLLNSL